MLKGGFTLQREGGTRYIERERERSSCVLGNITDRIERGRE
jgi:hypothetical protein